VSKKYEVELAYAEIHLLNFDCSTSGKASTKKAIRSRATAFNYIRGRSLSENN